MSIKYALNIITENLNEALKFYLIGRWKMHVSTGTYWIFDLKCYLFKKCDLVTDLVFDFKAIPGNDATVY